MEALGAPVLLGDGCLLWLGLGALVEVLLGGCRDSPPDRSRSEARVSAGAPLPPKESRGGAPLVVEDPCTPSGGSEGCVEAGGSDMSTDSQARRAGPVMCVCDGVSIAVGEVEPVYFVLMV